MHALAVQAGRLRTRACASGADRVWGGQQWHCVLLEEMGLSGDDANRQVQITYLNSVVMPDGDSSGSEDAETATETGDD